MIQDTPVTRQDRRDACGRAMLIGFEGTTLNAELKSMLKEIKPLGVILFARNIESPIQVAELNQELKSFRKDEPLLVSVDQEGGRVQRIKSPLPHWPPMMQVGNRDNIQDIEGVGYAMGRELRAMNFDINYAPVLDVHTNDDNPIIGDRAFSTHPEHAGVFASAYLRGLNRADVGGCGKHFPGHGDTDTDSHLELPRLSFGLDRLRDVEWRPYRHAVQAGLDAVMSAHVVIEGLDEDLPATLSAHALSFLREELKFQGVLISDDLDMKALADNFSPEESVRRGMNAGIDVFLSCRNPETITRAFEGLVKSNETKEISNTRLMEASKRGNAWRKRWYRAPVPTPALAEILSSTQHQDLLESLVSPRS